MLTTLCSAAKATSLLLAFGAWFLFFQAMPEARRPQADRQAMESCIIARASFMAQIPATYPAWRRERMLAELPDCWSLPRPVWRSRRAAAAVYLFVAAAFAVGFALVLRELRFAEEAPEA